MRALNTLPVTHTTDIETSLNYLHGEEPLMISQQFIRQSRTPHTSSNPEVHYRVHNSPPLVPVLCQTNAVHNLRPIPSKSVLILSTQLCLSLPNGLISSGFLTKGLPVLRPYACHMPVHPTAIDLIALRVFGEQYKSRGFSLCTFLQPAVPCSLVRSKIFLSTLFPNTTNPCFSLHVEDQS